MENRPDSSEEFFAAFIFRGTQDTLTTPLPVDADIVEASLTVSLVFCTVGG